MQMDITGRRMPITAKFRELVESKMKRVMALVPQTQRIQVVVTHEGNPRQADTAKRVEITMSAGSTVVRAEASSADEASALDMALDKLTLRLRRTRDRQKDHRKGYQQAAAMPLDDSAYETLDAAGAASEQLVAPQITIQVEGDEESKDDANSHAAFEHSPQAAVASDLGSGESVEVQVGDTPIVIRRKLHIAEPMSIDEALYEMELIGHDFFLFVNSATSRPSVVYRRHGWSYGIFEIDTPEHVRPNEQA